MKKLTFLTLAFFASALFVNAQTFYNGGFENWSEIAPIGFEEPDYWITSNIAGVPSGLPANATKVTEAQSGTYALKLENITEPGTNDVYIGAAVYINGVESTPEKMSGYYKATLMGGDVSGISILLRENGFVVGAGDIEFSDNVGEYTHFEIPIEYFMPSAAPDTAYITVLASTDDATSGTALFLDGLTFGLANAVEAPLEPVFKTLLMPNPASYMMRIETPAEIGEVDFIVFDIQGRQLKEVNFHRHSILDVSNFLTGRYYYEVRKVDGQLLDGGSFYVVK